MTSDKLLVAVDGARHRIPLSGDPCAIFFLLLVFFFLFSVNFKAAVENRMHNQVRKWKALKP